MRAVVVHAFGDIGEQGVSGVETVPEPVPGERDVLVEVHAAPVNYVDTVVIAGKYQFKPRLPFIPGKGPAGVVVKTGSGVTRLKEGDRVLAMAEQGGYAQMAVVDESQCYVMPESMSFAEASSMSLAYDTAWFALRERGRFTPGETVLVLGATGAVGQAAVQIAHALGGKVLAGISRTSRAEEVLAAGADAIIDLSRPDLRNSLRDAVMEATDGHGADIVLDPLGGDIFDAAIRAVAWCGRLVVIGFAAGRIPEVRANYLLVKNIEVSGLQISDYRKRMPEKVAAAYAEIFELYGAGRIKAAPVETFALEEFAAALEALQSRSLNGRAVLLPQQERADGKGTG